jgi:cytochrome oxidase Cu insertion factor (SCO1/SenC/PrrC family)
VKLRILTAAVLAFLSLAKPVSSQAQHHPTSPEHPLNKGAKAPNFNLTDQNGRDQSLEAMLKNGKVAVIFHRSASW